MLHIFWLSCIYCIDKLVTCESTLEMKHLIFLFKNVTTCGQMLSVFSLIFKHFNISSNAFLAAKINQNEKKIAPPGVVCHRLPENAFQVNQLYNVTWSNIQLDYDKVSGSLFYWNFKATIYILLTFMLSNFLMWTLKYF